VVNINEEILVQVGLGGKKKKKKKKKEKKGKKKKRLSVN
jgi:hypothetical protein